MKNEDNQKCVILVPVVRYIEPECERALQWLERNGHAVSALVRPVAKS